MQNQTQYVPTKADAYFVWELLTKYTVCIMDMCDRHNLNGDVEGTRIANLVCQHIAPDRMKTLLSLSNSENIVYITTLRTNRDWFLNKLSDLLTVFNHPTKGNKAMALITDTPESKNNKEKDISGTNKKMSVMSITDIITLRRLTSTSIAITSLLENIYTLQEARYVQHSSSLQHTIQRTDYQQYARQASLASMHVQAGFNGSQFPSDQNPYAEMFITKEQLDSADKKIMELLHILFPDQQ